MYTENVTREVKFNEEFRLWAVVGGVLVVVVAVDFIQYCIEFEGVSWCLIVDVA